MVSHLIGEGRPSDFDAYLKQHKMSFDCANDTIDSLAAQLHVWHRFVSDIRTALAGHHNFEVDGRVQGHRNLAARLEVIALSTSKAALDCCLGGLYVQGFMLTRHLFETWQRLAYTLLNPETANMWLSPAGAIPTPPSDGKMRTALLRSPKHKRWAGQVEKKISDLDLLAHPTYMTITAPETVIEGFLSLGGVFSNDEARDLMRLAAVAQMLILDEHRRHMSPTPEWSEQHRLTLVMMKDGFPELSMRIEYSK